MRKASATPRYLEFTAPEGAVFVDKPANYKFPKDLTGYKFSKLTVLSKCEKTEIFGNKPRTKWLCRCDCGNEVEVLRNNLIRDIFPTQSCGCIFKESVKYNFKDLTGEVFGQLTVIKLLDEKTKTRGAYWECECECGKIVKLATNSLVSGNNKTCGDREIHGYAQFTGCGEILGMHISAIRNSATYRKISYDLSPEYLWALFLKQDRKCAWTGKELVFGKHHKNYFIDTTASLDRIDSDGNYVEGNVQWVHKHLNKMKNKFKDEEFFSLIFDIVKHQSTKKARPNFDEYFLNIAFQVAERSEDESTKHGAVIVNKATDTIISTGYNALVKGLNKEDYDLTRPNKYLVYLHAEENALLNSPVCIRNIPGGAKIYVTGKICPKCLQLLVNAGIDEIYMAKRRGTRLEDENTEKLFNQIVRDKKIKVVEMTTDCHIIYKTW